MISSDLTGNISDHIVRYLLCRTVAEKNGYKYGINPIASHDYYGGKIQMSFFDNINYGEPNYTPYGELPPETDNVWTEKREHYDTHDYHPFQPDIFNVGLNTKLAIYCGQDANYFDKNKVTKWLKIKEENIKEYEDILLSNHIELSSNLCVINCRGGEYTGVSSLFLREEYYKNAIKHMKKINSNMKFIVITDDVPLFQKIFDFPVYHFGIGCDYYILNNAKNLIISNSGFGIFPSWTNIFNPYIIAPWGWARYNLGIWANSNIQSFGFNFMDREGVVYEA
jgi:hypothetical protein